MTPKIKYNAIPFSPHVGFHSGPSRFLHLGINHPPPIFKRPPQYPPAPFTPCSLQSLGYGTPSTRWSFSQSAFPSLQNLEWPPRPLLPGPMWISGDCYSLNKITNRNYQYFERWFPVPGLFCLHQQSWGTCNCISPNHHHRIPDWKWFSIPYLCWGGVSPPPEPATR